MILAMIMCFSYNEAVEQKVACYLVYPLQGIQKMCWMLFKQQKKKGMKVIATDLIRTGAVSRMADVEIRVPHFRCTIAFEEIILKSSYFDDVDWWNSKKQRLNCQEKSTDFKFKLKSVQDHLYPPNERWVNHLADGINLAYSFVFNTIINSCIFIGKTDSEWIEHAFMIEQFNHDKK